MKKSYNLFKLGSFLVLFASFILALSPAVYAEDKPAEAKEAAATDSEKAGDAATTDEKKEGEKKKGKDGEEPECD